MHVYSSGIISSIILKVRVCSSQELLPGVSCCVGGVLATWTKLSCVVVYMLHHRMAISLSVLASAVVHATLYDLSTVVSTTQTRHLLLHDLFLGMPQMLFV
jgi:hypothetical protein